MELLPTVGYESTMLWQQMLGRQSWEEQCHRRGNPVFHSRRHTAPKECPSFRWVESTLELLPGLEMRISHSRH